MIKRSPYIVDMNKHTHTQREREVFIYSNKLK